MWTEQQIAAHLARFTFQRKHLVVPNCNWTGNECDLLVVAPNLRIIDVEIKISRADLKADADKDKWWHSFDRMIDGPYPRMDESRKPRRPREWPPRVWKHYYCMPKEIWKPELLRCISPVSGVLLVGNQMIWSERRAKCNRDAKPIDAEDAIDIARLAGLRMWAAFAARDAALQEARDLRQAA